MRYLFISAGLAAALFVLPVAGSPAVAASSPVKITLACYSNPEKTTIKNVSTHSLTVKTVGSTYKPYSFEPFTVNKVLAAGKSVTYQTGSKAKGANELSHDYIYNNNGSDGARVTTSAGTFTKHC